MINDYLQKYALIRSQLVSSPKGAESFCAILRICLTPSFTFDAGLSRTFLLQTKSVTLALLNR